MQVSDIVLWENGYYSTWKAYAYATIAKQFCIILFLACLAPVTYAGGMISKMLASLGRRTLQAYLINIFVQSYAGSSKMQHELFVPPGPKGLQFAGCILATSVACCPLSEWCFGFITSPQWMLDGSAMVISQAGKLACSPKVSS